MKQLTRQMSRAILIGLTCIASVTVHAGPYWGGGYRGGYHHHHRGGSPWVGPALVGGVLLGAALTSPVYAAPVVPAYPAYPAYTVPYPPVTYGAPMPPQPVGYYCPSSGQYYPNVPTCSVPWQLL